MTDFVRPFDAEGSAIDPRELRLQEIRRKAAAGAPTLPGIAKRPGVDILPASADVGYYGKPTLKTPAWTVEVPLYFFVGGAAGAAAIIANLARLTGAEERLVRDAQGLAAIGGFISPALLIADLGMPSRFLNMLRVFKVQSPMSVGSWTLVAFSTSAAASAFFRSVEKRQPRFRSVKVLANASAFASAITGAVLSTYTGVLLGATAIPVWNQNADILPVHFALSGLATASSLLELRGNESPALNTIGLATAFGETLIGGSIERRKNPALKPLKSGSSGWLTRLGGLLSGPLPLVLRLLSLGAGDETSRKLRKVAAASSVAGSLVTRFAWTEAGKASAADPAVPLQLPPGTSAED